MQPSERDFSRPLQGQPPGQAHLVGLCGSGMRALADYLLAAGWRVTGSDQSLNATAQADWARRGVQALIGHDAAHLPQTLDLLVYSLAIPATNPEREAAIARGVPSLSYVQTLGLLFEQHTGFGIAGTHGKTTTCAILAHLLQQNNRSAALLFGGLLPHPTAARVEFLIGECCEFQQAFLHMRPRWGAILAVEPDHFDCYPDSNSLLQAFSGFAANIAPEGLLLVNADDHQAVLAAQAARCPVEYFTLQDSVQPSRAEVAAEECWHITATDSHVSGWEFRIRRGSETNGPLRLPLWGRHQLANAFVAWRLAQMAGLSPADLAESLATFPGVSRRFQERGEAYGWRMLDDYAHHPTEIRATLAACRQRYGGAELLVAFQPHQILRTQRLLEEFATAFEQADRVLILPIFAAREQADQRVISVAQELVARGRRQHPRFEFCPSLDHLRLILDDTDLHQSTPRLRVCVTLGAGDIDRIHHEVP